MTLKYVCLGIAFISSGALGAALISQYVFGLHPCELCIYQRIPYLLCIGFGIIGFLFSRFSRLALISSGLSFLVNSAIAFFHSGVERKWWAGLSGCSTPDMSGSIEDLLKRIQNTAVTRCDEIPWSLFGLSMANYNIVVCLGLASACLWCAKYYRPAPK